MSVISIGTKHIEIYTNILKKSHSEISNTVDDTYLNGVKNDESKI